MTNTTYSNKSDKSLKGTFANQACPSFNEGSLENTLNKIIFEH